METETVVLTTNVRTDNEEKLIYNEIPKQVSRKDFNKYIDSVECTFGWQDTYRKLAISYDRL